MALLASNYGNEIYLGATKGDTTKDKDYVFKTQIEGMLNYFALDSHKVPQKGYPYKVHMPFKDMSKVEIVTKFIKAGGNVNKLMKYSRSCYIGKEKECGKCRSCVRKAVALILNGIEYEYHFSKDPLLNVPPEIHKKMLSRDSEADDYEKALKLRKLMNETKKHVEDVLLK